MWFIVSDITRGEVKFKSVGCIWRCTNDEAVMDWMHWIPWMAKDIKSARHLTYVNHFWNVNSITISIDFTAMLNICVLPRLKRNKNYLAALNMLSILSFCDTVSVSPSLVNYFRWCIALNGWIMIKMKRCLRCCSSSSLDRPDFFTLRQAVKKLTE